MQKHSVSLSSYAVSIASHWTLLLRLVQREFTQRFRGSILGLAWAVVTPLLTALVYTFIFGTVFKAKWGAGSLNSTDFTLLFLAGLAIYGIFAEAMTRSPVLLLGNVSYIKRVVFPIEILPLVVVCAAAVNAGIALAIIVTLNIVIYHSLPFTIVLLPVIFIPYILFVTAISLFFSSAGVFLRDITQVTSFVVTIGLFLTPIFYPREALPAVVRPYLWLNPLTFPVEQTRAVLIFGQAPDWTGLVLYTIFSLAALSFGFWWFQRTRNGFADVV